MATHSSILVWRIQWTEEPGGLQFTESQRSDMSEHTAHTQAGSSAAVPSTQEVSQEAVLSVQYGLEHVCMRALSG